MTRYMLEWLIELRAKGVPVEFYGGDDKSKISVGHEEVRPHILWALHNAYLTTLIFLSPMLLYPGNFHRSEAKYHPYRNYCGYWWHWIQHIGSWLPLWQPCNISTSSLQHPTWYERLIFLLRWRWRLWSNICNVSRCYIWPIISIWPQSPAYWNYVPK